MTEVLAIDATHPQAEAVGRAADCLRRGGLVALPTETVYGLGVHALDAAAVRRLFAAKGRPANDPLIVHVTSLAAAAGLVAELPAAAHALAGAFWPGPLTLVMRRSAAVPDDVTAGLETVAIRVPAHPVARAILDAAAIPIAAPSANLFSRPSPTTAAHVLEDLRDRIDMVVDAGATPVGVESTVLDLTAIPPVVLRPGAVTLQMLRTVIPEVTMRASGGNVDGDHQPMRSPGLLTRHYSPRAPLTLYRGVNARERLAADAAAAHRAGRRIVVLTFDGDIDEVSRGLYAALREADVAGAEAILARDVTGAEGLAEAIRDRLRRAAARIIET